MWMEHFVSHVIKDKGVKILWYLHPCENTLQRCNPIKKIWWISNHMGSSENIVEQCHNLSMQHTISALICNHVSISHTNMWLSIPHILLEKCDILWNILS